MSNYNLPTVLANSYKGTWKYVASALAMLINSISHTAFTVRGLALQGSSACPESLWLQKATKPGRISATWRLLLLQLPIRNPPARLEDAVSPQVICFTSWPRNLWGLFPFGSQDRRTLPWNINFLTSPFPRNYLVFPLPCTSDTWQVFL